MRNVFLLLSDSHKWTVLVMRGGIYESSESHKILSVGGRNKGNHCNGCFTSRANRNRDHDTISYEKTRPSYQQTNPNLIHTICCAVNSCCVPVTWSRTFHTAGLKNINNWLYCSCQSTNSRVFLYSTRHHSSLFTKVMYFFHWTAD